MKQFFKINKLKKLKEKLLELKSKGVQLRVKNNKIAYKTLKGALSSDDLDFLRTNKADIIEYLNSIINDTVLKADIENINEPFPQNHIQRAYCIGKSKNIMYGGVCCHTYMELEYERLDAFKVEEALNQLIKIHPMLRAKINVDGTQQILKSVPKIRIIKQSDDDIDGIKINKLRERMQCNFYNNGEWPQFEFAVTHLPDTSIFHFSMEFVLSDWVGMRVLISQFEDLYFNNIYPPKATLSFRDYILYKEENQYSIEYKKSKEYWLNRLKDFPLSPQLPIKKERKDISTAFKRYFFELDNKHWEQFKNKALSLGTTPTSLMLTLYSYIIQRWSENKIFGINLTLLDRPNIHPDISGIIGDFTKVLLHEVNWQDFKENEYSKQVQQINKQLFTDIDHSHYSGVEFLRELTKIRGENCLYPYVLTSALGLNNSMVQEPIAVYKSGLTQTPQVLIDCQVTDGSFGMRVNWDVRIDAFEDCNIPEDMFIAFTSLLYSVGEDEKSLEDAFILHDSETNFRNSAIIDSNRTQSIKRSNFLHEGFIKSVENYPNNVFIAMRNKEISYVEAYVLVAQVTASLKRNGVKRGDKVCVALGKSPEQIISILAILFCGAVYVPLDIDQGDLRIEKIIKQSQSSFIISDDRDRLFGGVDNHLIYEELLTDDTHELSIIGDVNDTAYIIFTSGSTGFPKGVEMSHKAAMNTISDLIERFNITNESKVLALSKASFDLSVFDIFGIATASGTIVLPQKSIVSAEEWHILIQHYGINLWNTVPSFIEIYIEYLRSISFSGEISLKNIWLSGDIFRVSLLKKIRHYVGDARIISMGGATEAGIWSIFHECKPSDEQAQFIPYGRPLSNQKFEIFDSNLKQTPTLVSGELYIMGDSLATSYYGDCRLTANSFIKNPNTGETMYATGDFGRYLPNGEIEFLGRKDTQIKINGYRIELGEIERALLENSMIDAAVCIVYKNVVIAALCSSLHDADAITSHLRLSLTDYMIPKRIIFVDSIPLTTNGKVDNKKIIELLEIQIDKEQEQKQNIWDDRLLTIKRIVEDVLECKIERPEDSFYSYGADSLSLSKIVNVIIHSGISNVEFDQLLEQIMNYPSVLETEKYLLGKNEK